MALYVFVYMHLCVLLCVFIYKGTHTYTCIWLGSGVDTDKLKRTQKHVPAGSEGNRVVSPFVSCDMEDPYHCCRKG